MKKIAFLFLLLWGVSCNLLQEKGIAFKIKNSSDAAITAVKISTSENLESVFFDQIPKNENQEGFLPMKGNITDGSYTLSYTRKDGSTNEISSGYYSNGGALNSYIRFEIKNDTTLVKFGEFPN